MTFSKISVLVPTRKRVARLRTMLESYDLTTADCSELLFRIDEDDEETSAFLATLPERLKHAVVKGPRYEGYRSTHQFLSDLLPWASGDVLMVGNDDMVFETSEWDRYVLEAANKFPDGLFDLGVETLNTTHFPFSIVSRYAVEALGFLYDPRIFWGDIFLRDVMAAFDRAVLLPGVKITHEWAGYKPDVTFQEAQHAKQTIGTPEYWQHHAVVVAEAVARLRGVTV